MIKEFLKNISLFNNNDVNNKFLYVIKILLKCYVIYFISLLVAEFVIIGCSIPFGYNMTDHQLPYDKLLIATFYGYIITILFFILFTKKKDKIKLSEIGLDNNFKTFFKGIILGILSLAIIIGLMLVTKVIKFNGLSSNIKVIYIVLFFFGYLIQSTMEELFCRGYLLHRLKNKVPVLYAVIISFLAFSIGHFSKMFGDGFLIGLFGCINLFLISMIWSILTLKDKNIYSAIGYHFIWNFTLFNIIGLNLSGLDITTSIFDFSVNKNFLAGASYGIESTIFTLVILLIILGVLLYGYLKNKKD